MSAAADDHGIDASFVGAQAATAQGMELDGEFVILNTATKELHRLNSSASLVWRCLDGHSSVADIAHDIAAVTDADPAQVREDLLQLLRTLVRQGLVGPAHG